ncbi:hypothetical protein ACZ87_02009, partial [Candidatus Erwinia dacicola]
MALTDNRGGQARDAAQPIPLVIYLKLPHLIQCAEVQGAGGTAEQVVEQRPV